MRTDPDEFTQYECYWSWSATRGLVATTLAAWSQADAMEQVITHACSPRLPSSSIRQKLLRGVSQIAKPLADGFVDLHMSFKVGLRQTIK